VPSEGLPGSLGLPRGLDPESFLTLDWQKRPRLFRQAFPGFRSPLPAEELAGLACEGPEVESRLVLGGPAGPWRLREGPFGEADFTCLPERDWTLLVHDVDKHLPDLAAIFGSFDFLPRWRFDDLMISHAAAGGSVGPHVDAYDVFLLQAEGCRRWAVSTSSGNSRRRDDSELDVLADFQPEQEWLLEPGDMLYLPPGVAHFGVAEGACMTWSIGFRAPDSPGMLSDLVEFLTQQMPEGLRYEDSDLRLDEAGGRLHPRAIERLRRVLAPLLALDDEGLADWFARFVTEPKPWLRAEADGTPTEACEPILKSGRRLARRSNVLALWRERGDGGIALYVDGEAYRLPVALAPVVEALCNDRPLPLAPEDFSRSPAALKLIDELLERGKLEWFDHD
jgi:50S ribosomal protein L16 3-hydroxylase